MLKKLPKSPCYNKGKDCVERSPGCRTNCLKYKQYEEEYFQYEKYRQQEYALKDYHSWRKK